VKLSIVREKLLAALEQVGGVVERRNTIPVLANVKLAVDDLGLTVTGTDLGIQVTSTVDAKAVTAGATTIASQTLMDIVRKLPSGVDVTLEADEASAIIKAGRSRFQLQVLPASDFPSFSAENLGQEFTISAGKLRELIGAVRFAISHDDARFYLHGIHLHTMGDQLVAVATDGHRLAKYTMLAPSGLDCSLGIIVPKKTIENILKVIDTKSDVVISFSNERIRVACGSTVLISKLIDGSFPDYQRVIPSEFSTTAVVDIRDLTAALDRISSVAEKGRATRFSFEAGKVAVETVNSSAGTASEDVSCIFEAEPLKIGFNSRYVMDILDSLNSETVEFRLGDPGAPAMLVPSGRSDVVTVCMPMRV
jgi:DNA polymerase-3 subunit beta